MAGERFELSKLAYEANYYPFVSFQLGARVTALVCLGYIPFVRSDATSFKNIQSDQRKPKKQSTLASVKSGIAPEPFYPK